jgi:hypothetical protein
VAGSQWLGGFAIIPVQAGTVIASCFPRPDSDAHARALVAPLEVASEDGEQDDVRTLPARFEKAGERFRMFDEAVSLMTEERFGPDEWFLEGPRSAAWWLKSTGRLGMTPLSRHQK